MTALLHFLTDQPFVTIFLVLGLGYLLGKLSFGFFSLGSTGGSLLAALVVGVLAFQLGHLRFQIPDLLGTTFLALFTYAVGLRVGPQFVEGLRREGWQLVVLVTITTTSSFLLAYYGARLLHLPPGYSSGILSGSNTVSAVMGVAKSAVDNGLYQLPKGLTAQQVTANIAAGYSLSYILSVLSIVLLIRNLPGMFGIDPVAAARVSEKEFGRSGHALPGTSEAFHLGMQPVDVRVFEVREPRFAGQPMREVFEQLGVAVLRMKRDGHSLSLRKDPVIRTGDQVTVGGPIDGLLEAATALGPEVVDNPARRFEVAQAEIVVTQPEALGQSISELHQSDAAYGVRIRALFRGGHEIALPTDERLRKRDVLRVVGPPKGVARLTVALGQGVRPTDATDIITLGLGIAGGYAIGLATVSIAGIPVGLGAMGGVVLAGMVISIVRSIDPALGGPMPEGARAFLEGIGVNLFVTTLGLTVAPALVGALSQGWGTVGVLILGVVCATVPTCISWVVGLYALKMDPMVLAGAVSGARNSTTAMKAISGKARSNIPSLGYPVTYALSTVVFLIYGYISMIFS